MLINLHQERNITLMMITHDASVAEYCQRIVRIMDGQIIGDEKIS